MAEINFDDMPEQLRALFIEREGQYALDPQKLGEFQKTSEDVRRALAARDHEKANAEKLRKDMEALKEQMGGIDPAQLPAALEAQKRIEELEHQQLIAEKKFEEAAERKFTRQMAEMKRQMDTLNQTLEQRQREYENLFQEYGKVRINDALSREFIEAGVDPDFLDAAVQMEARRWEIDPQTRSPVPIEYIENGQTKVTAMGSDGKPLTMKEHARIFLRDKPRWAVPSNGSHASHQNASGSGNPFRISETDARDLRKYEAVRARAQQAGADVEIVAG